MIPDHKRNEVLSRVERFHDPRGRRSGLGHLSPSAFEEKMRQGQGLLPAVREAAEPRSSARVAAVSGAIAHASAIARRRTS